MIDYDNNKVFFSIQDLNLLDKKRTEQYLESIKLDTNKYEAILYKYGSVKISLTNISILELSDENNKNNIVNTNFETDFQLIIKDKLPIHMEDLIGLMIKKIFYNLKVFIDNF
tara:strand:- start:4185 stop:4523 length:339 start_codon:yes stop_codon:yes gene_type:complete